MAELLDSLASRTVLHTLEQYLIALRGQPEATSDVICGRFVGLIAHDKRVKFCDPG